MTPLEKALEALHQLDGQMSWGLIQAKPTKERLHETLREWRKIAQEAIAYAKNAS